MPAAHSHETVATPAAGPLACPDCRALFEPSALGLARDGARLECRGCGAGFPVRDGFARLFREERVRGTDRLMRVAYNAFAPFHDAAIAHLIPALRFGDEASLRDGVMRRLDLGALADGTRGRPARILEVGIGSGANLAWVDRDLPRGVRAEIWGVDLSINMISRCRRRLADDPRLCARADVTLVMADAHALPFADHSFDRVFHVGAIGGFRDPRAALGEMARVARPGTPIVVFDEQLDPAGAHGLAARAAFRVITFYDRDPHCPTELLPPGAVDVREEQLSRAYYCLSFTMPPSGGPP